MTHYAFSFCGQTLHALASGALYWPSQNLLCVSDLHFGKAQRYVPSGGAALPPYETQDTLLRLDHDIAETGAKTIICLGDSFDSTRAGFEIEEATRASITRLQAGRKWIWIEGNHDPGPVGLGGSHLADIEIETIVFRHIAEADASREISGHYHPKTTLRLRGRSITRRCFAVDTKRIILPAYGTYTGGLDVKNAAIRQLYETKALCILTGSQAQAVPMPR